MGYLFCNADSAIATCDPHYWDLNKRKNKSIPITRTHTITEFLYTDIVTATNAFSAESYLGKGSHGRVYRATLNTVKGNGNLVVAVKTTKLTSKNKHNHANAKNCTGCGNCTSPVENEIEILSQVPSPRLVNIIGYCTDPNDNKLIVVEYMPNGSLHDLLHSTTRPPGWTRRIRFALQVAKAVRTLHASNPPVIHRDIKSSNVLIDRDWKARVGDFGLALRGHVEDVRVKCTPPAGTLGYLDPCYLAPGDLSAKSDVFSFGILLLEIISGRNAIDVNYSPPSVVDWAVPLIRRGDFAGLCDRRIGTPLDQTVLRLLAVLAARCVRSTAEKRPGMVEVVECIKLARKRISESPLWRSLRRRVARVESAQPLMKWEAYDCDYDYNNTNNNYDCDWERNEEVVKIVKSGSSSRRKSKVSSVAGVEYENKPSKLKSKSNKGARSKSSKKVARSKTIGSVSGCVGSRRSGIQMVSEKTGGVRLKKSKSMGVLQGPVLLHHDAINWCDESETMAMSKLVISEHKKLEKKMLEKPLVHSYGWESE
ncbi:serine/threonine-protein kinase-like protein At3g51990 [Cicer arietinum]|uniref:Serine/threonine-protein kinase-like protein At1g28390 n=1 Tax=Cicer arietinum TaxID=3827 RepID=A0A1S2Y9S3_CICAR|nr:serine/threonine-protein kinase-like protein At1g28390 [Cicer arietinum]